MASLFVRGLAICPWPRYLSDNGFQSSSALDCLSRLKIGGHRHPLDRFVRGIFTPYLLRISNSIFSGPVTHLLSMLRVLTKILSHAGEEKKKTKNLKGFKFRTLINGRFQVTS